MLINVNANEIDQYLVIKYRRGRIFVPRKPKFQMPSFIPLSSETNINLSIKDIQHFKSIQYFIQNILSPWNDHIQK